MGDWGRNGRLRNITVRSGEGWTSLAKRLGLNERQFEDLMRENENITQLKAGQTVRLGNLRRNDNAYVSNHGAMAAGMASNEQVRQLYAANGTGGVGSDRLRSPNLPIYGGNFGYNTTTKAGRAQQAWQNNPNNPSGVNAQAGTGAANKPPSPVTPAQPTAPANLAPTVGNQAAQNWQAQQQQRQTAITQGAALERGLPLASKLLPVKPIPTTIGPQQPRFPLSTALPTSGYTQSQPAFQQSNTATQAQIDASYGLPSAPTQGPTQPSGVTQGPPAPDLAMAQFNAEQARFDAQQIDASFGSGNPAFFPTTITTAQLGGLQSLYANHTQAEITGRLAQLGYIQDVTGNFVRAGDTTASGGPNLVPSGYGDYAGLPAYEPPPYGYINYGAGAGGGGGGGRGGDDTKKKQKFQRTYQQDGTWRIGG